MKEYKNRIIALITDFGIKGTHYIASMKAIIFKICPMANIIDISHSITPFSIIEASYILKTSYSYFPKGSIFIIVVDPGVGSKRDILILETKDNYYFIGPDNGIFTHISHSAINCFIAKNKNYFNNPISNTFHGRDIMAPLAAYLYNRIEPNEFGPKINVNNILQLTLDFKIINNQEIEGIIQYIDTFGNAITNIEIDNDHIVNSNIFLENGQKLKLYIKNNEYACNYSLYFESIPKKSLLIIKGSTDYLEISINKGNASDKLNIFTGDKIKIKFD
ncbi:MAG: SAM-dependent chlorinase/fluorinase [Candidatus Lokiarchaeota archaeon]|nr:SAM-dependent chlorinase/fluorinase [Candidatus Lokiarchaeota archaeon]